MALAVFFALYTAKWNPVLKACVDYRLLRQRRTERQPPSVVIQSEAILEKRSFRRVVKAVSRRQGYKLRMYNEEMETFVH